MDSSKLRDVSVASQVFPEQIYVNSEIQKQVTC